MPLELIREAIKVNQVIAKDSAQTIVENDIIVPDTKPDISQILLFDGDAVVTNTEISGNKAVIYGIAVYKILYVSDDPEQTVKSINTNANFTHELDIEEAGENSKCKANCDIEHIDYNILNGRKVNVKAVIKSDYKLTSEGEQEIVSDLSGIEDVQILRNNANINCYIGANDTDYTIAEALEIPTGKPSVVEILRNDIKISGKDYKVTENKVVVKGELNVATLYIADDETRSIQTMEHEIPFTQFVDLYGAHESASCDIDYRVVNSSFEVAEDSDGELRVVNSEINLAISVEGYEKKNIEVIDDAYSPRINLILDKEAFRMEEPVTESRSQIILKDTIAINEGSPDISEVFNVLCKPSLSEYRIAEDKVVVEGAVNNNVLYLAGSSEQPVCCHQQEIPFKQYIDAKGVKPEMLCEISLYIDHCNYSMVSANEVEIRLVIGVNLKLINQSMIPLIVKAEDTPADEKRLASQPSITIYFSQPGDTLWKVAKRYYTTVEDIKRVNGLVDRETLVVGQQVIIPRRL